MIDAILTSNLKKKIVNDETVWEKKKRKIEGTSMNAHNDTREHADCCFRSHEVYYH